MIANTVPRLRPPSPISAHIHRRVEHIARLLRSTSSERLFIDTFVRLATRVRGAALEEQKPTRSIVDRRLLVSWQCGGLVCVSCFATHSITNPRTQFVFTLLSLRSTLARSIDRCELDAMCKLTTPPWQEAPKIDGLSLAWQGKAISNPIELIRRAHTHK